MLKLKAGLNTMLLLDVVKNMPDFLTGENMQDYDYKMSDIVVDNGREQYAIEFSARNRKSTIIIRDEYCSMSGILPLHG